MDIEYKIKKYKFKNSLNKKKIYKKKLDHYLNLQGGAIFSTQEHGDTFFTMMRHAGHFTNKKFIDYYYLQFKSRNNINLDQQQQQYFRQLFEELTFVQDWKVKPIENESRENYNKRFFEQKLDVLEQYKPNILHFKIEKNDFVFIFNDTVSD